MRLSHKRVDELIKLMLTTLNQFKSFKRELTPSDSRAQIKAKT